jgi:hypothetical protein
VGTKGCEKFGRIEGKNCGTKKEEVKRKVLKGVKES